MSHEDCLRHVRSAILRQPGGTSRWDTLLPVLTAMTGPQQVEFYAALRCAEEEGKRQAETRARQMPWKFTGS